MDLISLDPPSSPSSLQSSPPSLQFQWISLGWTHYQNLWSFSGFHHQFCNNYCPLCNFDRSTRQDQPSSTLLIYIAVLFANIADLFANIAILFANKAVLFANRAILFEIIPIYFQILSNLINTPLLLYLTTKYVSTSLCHTFIEKGVVNWNISYWHYFQ